MALFRRKPMPVPVPVVEERAADLNWVRALANSGLSYGSFSGQSVTLDSAMRNAAIWACIRQMTATITALPVDVIRTTGGKRRQLSFVDSPEIIRRPHQLVSRRAWVGQVIRSLLSDGNAYGEVLGVDGSGRPTQIATIWPERVKWSMGVPMVDGVVRDLWPGGSLWHLPVSFLLPPGADVAMSPIRYGAESIGTGIAAERFGADFFAAGGMPLQVLTLDAKNPTATQVTEVASAYDAAAKNRRTFVKGTGVLLENGPDVNVADSQFIDLMRFEVEQACRWIGMPPSLVYAAVSGQNVTYANVTQSDLHYLKHSVAGWLVDLEDALTEFVAGPLSVKFNVDAVLRMDASARTIVHAQRLQMRTRTVNEVRRLEDEEPFDDPIYDEPGIPGDALPNVTGLADVAPQGGAA